MVHDGPLVLLAIEHRQCRHDLLVLSGHLSLGEARPAQCDQTQMLLMDIIAWWPSVLVPSEIAERLGHNRLAELVVVAADVHELRQREDATQVQAREIAML